MTAPSSGIKVIEISTPIAAPFAARLMAEFGADYPVRLNGSIATTFGCPFEGKIDEDRVLQIVENCARWTRLDQPAVASARAGVLLN